MVHEQAMSTAFVKVGAGLFEERINVKFEIEFLGAQLRRVFDKSSGWSVGSFLLYLCGISIWVIRVLIFAAIALVGEIAEELAGLCLDTVDTACPNLDATIKRGRRALEVDRVVYVVAQNFHVRKIVNEGIEPRVCGIDFLW